MTSNTTWLAYEAPHPWGPWTLVQTNTWNPQGYYNPVMISKSLTNAGNGMATGVLATAGDFSQAASNTGFYTLALVPVTVVTTFSSGGTCTAATAALARMSGLSTPEQNALTTTICRMVEHGIWCGTALGYTRSIGTRSIIPPMPI